MTDFLSDEEQVSVLYNHGMAIAAVIMYSIPLYPSATSLSLFILLNFNVSLR